MTYKSLRQVLKEGKKLRAFPLVDNPDSMVLLGSIQRQELVSSISELIGKQRRHQVCMQRYGFKLKQMQLQEQKQMQQPGLAAMGLALAAPFPKPHAQQQTC